MNRFTFTRNVAKISKYIEADPRNPTLVDNIVYQILIFPLSAKKKRSIIFKNKYVCADAALISTCYAYYLLMEKDVDENQLEDLLRKIFLGTLNFYKINFDEFNNMWSNRIHYFDLLFQNTKTSIYEIDFTPIVQDAALLFSHDICENKYIEFRQDTPAVLMDPKKQFLISQETFAYFKIMGSMIKKCIYR